MNDDALSPVIAVMLILAVAVTIFSVYNAEYLPGMKQQAEVEHLQKVEESMVRFGSALENAISLKRPLIMSEPIVLGGGDILLHSARSAGTIRVQQEENPYVIVSLERDPGDITYIPLYFVNFSYWPIDNFWVDQGYSWQYGVINVSWVSGDRWIQSVPLQYSTMEKAKNEKYTNSSLSRTLIEYECNNVDCSNVTISAVNMVPGKRNFSSGNGVGSFELTMNSSAETAYPNIHLTINPGDTPLRDSIQEWVEEINATIPVNVTLKIFNITVSTL